jgi:hypothetical protein
VIPSRANPHLLINRPSRQQQHSLLRPRRRRGRGEIGAQVLLSRWTSPTSSARTPRSSDAVGADLLSLFPNGAHACFGFGKKTQ